MVHQVTAHQKAMVLCWMWLADQATIKQEDPEAKSSSMSFAADIASDIVKKMFRLDVTAQSITNYYGLSQKNVEHAGIKWKYEVAAIMLRGLGKRLMTYHEFSGFLHEYDGKVSTSAASFLWGVRGICLLSNSWVTETIPHHISACDDAKGRARGTRELELVV